MSNSFNTLNDKAWEKLFYKYNILEHIDKKGLYTITAKQINEFREARLMTKFDHRSNLPLLFSENNLSILPVTRGSYIIGNFEAYHDFETHASDICKVKIPDFVYSIDFDNITSEATAINVAYLSGILADFIGDENLIPTVNGRMSSEQFDFNIHNKKTNSLVNISVSNSQIEIDAGYEGLETLTLIEAKNSISDDFLVRQLYYPFRLWQQKINKRIKTIYLIYANGIFSLYEYKFHEPNNYNSLILVKQKNYTLEQESISIDEIISLFDHIKVTEEPEGIPFPQADSFSRVINICELLYDNEFLTRDEITTNYDFDIRQTNYYTDACRYLGLVYKERDGIDGVKYFLTDKGKEIFKLNLKKRNLSFAKCILEKKAFNETFRRYLMSSQMPQKREIVKIMEASGLYNINSSETYKRRASTVLSWINWVLNLTR